MKSFLISFKVKKVELSLVGATSPLSWVIVDERSGSDHVGISSLLAVVVAVRLRVARHAEASG